jgi:hypothetical protein
MKYLIYNKDVRAFILMDGSQYGILCNFDLATRFSLERAKDISTYFELVLTEKEALIQFILDQ